MADRNFYRDQGQLEAGIVKLFARIVFTAAGVAALVAIRNKGIASISRTSAGLYVLTLQNTYQRVLNIAPSWVATSGLPGAPAFSGKSDTVGTTKTITFTTGAMSGGSGAYVATDPTDTDVLLLEITLSNSAAP